MGISDPIEIIQTNGYAGEERTAGIIARHFVILRKNTDRDGTDFLVDLPTPSAAHERTRAKGIRTFGVIQAKFFETKNAVYIDPSYAEEDGEPRNNFFLFVHTDNERGEPIRYFLTAKEVLELPTGSNGKKRFSITKENDRAAFREISTVDIVNKIKSGIQTYEKNASEKYIDRIFAPMRMRSGYDARIKVTEYILKRIPLPKNEDFPDECDARVVFARTLGNFVARPIDARWDLFESSGTWSWGYKGEGPKLLAMSILAHYLGWNSKPTWRQHYTFLLHVIANLHTDSDHIIQGYQIEEAISELIMREYYPV
jgi:hypothetical protein